MGKKNIAIVSFFIFIVIIVILVGVYVNNKKNKKETNDSKESGVKKQVEQIIETPKSWNDKGVFSEYYNKAYGKLQTLTIEEKVGQLLLARVPANNQIQDICDYKLGGYILFGKDTENETKESLKKKIQSYQSASNIPMIIATDEEGGTVVRVSSNPNLRKSKFLSPGQLYNSGGLELIRETTLEMSQLLDEVGINTNLAPVADVSENPNDFIYSRTLGKNAETTAKYVKTVIQTSKDGNVSYVLKHFPGYGNNKDTHTGISIDNRTLQEFEEKDFIPFKEGINEGAEAILVSHNIITQIDKNNPASLSPQIHEILKENLGFTGVIITDDLAMDAIKDYTTGSPAVNAVLAGNDMLIITDYETGYKDIINAIKNEKIKEEQIDKSVLKILAWKYYKGLIK